MNQFDLNEYFESLLSIKKWTRDVSQNGIQVENSGGEITKIAFATDACDKTISRAKALGANMLFVHHGLFWASPQTVTGIFYKRIRDLISADMVLFACHLPLDAHPTLGNNGVLAQKLNLQNRKPFCEYAGDYIGFQGDLVDGETAEDLCKKLDVKPFGILPFGKKIPQKACIVSGGASHEIEDAVKAGADIYITGEINHQMYHFAAENEISVLALGHYASEIWGVRAVMEQVKKDLNIDVEFIHMPTGL